METVGLICEYNPFHNGHARQLRLVRQMLGEDCVLVCLMSGNYVQRGLPAGFPKQVRAQAALRCGADLVLELPLTVAVASAEGFAMGCRPISVAASARLPSIAPILSTLTSTAPATAGSKPTRWQRMKYSATLALTASTAARASAVASP